MTPGKMAILEWDEGEMGLVAIADYELLALTPAEMQDQWLRMCDVHIETWDSHLTPGPGRQPQGQPTRLGIGSALSGWPGSTHVVVLEGAHHRGIRPGWTLMDHDGSRMYAVVQDEVALVQTFVFNPILDFWRNLES